jgi:hypothetical protein
MKRQMPIHLQNARRLELYEINAQRLLTASEAAELPSLEHRLYMRVWHQQQRDAEMAHRAKLQAQIVAQRASGPRRHVA